ncbi:universal stress protein [Natronomonas marina]|jgi:nucleotide-binding universal stress UspA family protein|uniref:universal stress protein n=1 Tax=Natronomonas marina TaxID=2961939 RepID=UPI0020C98747|nr:universal stress protein [Natronomonas marina]
MYRRILVPTDGSTGSAHVAMQAFDLAEQYGATVHLLYVVDRGLRDVLGDAESERELRESGERAVATLAELAETYDVETEPVIREGDPAGVIRSYAAEVDVDLIVMGTHGRSGLGRRLIGSVAETVVRRSERPVLTVRLPGSDETVTDADTAAAIVADALAEEGYDAEVEGVERQNHVWVVDATGEAGAFTVYVDPVTRRTSAIRRTEA